VPPPLFRLSFCSTFLPSRRFESISLAGLAMSPREPAFLDEDADEVGREDDESALRREC
jgi:hypothetical protein